MKLKVHTIQGSYLTRWLTPVLFAFIISPSVAQVTFTTAPENLQLYPRDAQNKASVVIEGKLLRKNYTQAILEVSEEKVLVKTLTSDFSSTDSVSFTFRAEIAAKPAEYSFKVMLLDKDQKKETVLEREGVVCGDFIILYGQSNIKALVGITEMEKQTDTRLLRNYDTPNNADPNAMQWYQAHQPYASVGVVGLHLQSLILARYGIPTCVLNGSVGGANLTSLINPDETLTNLNSYYGLLYSRVKKAGALGKVKAIIWRQGEAETCNWYPDIRDYPQNFSKLYAQLAKDYEGFTRFYNIQTGIQYCNQMEEAGELREYIRTTKYLFERIETTNMHDLPLSDDVHYSMEGYMKAAEELLPLLGRDIYGDPDSMEVHPPDIQKVLITPSRDTLILVYEEDQKLVYPEPVTVNGFAWKMEDYFYVNTTTAYTDDIVVKGWTDRNRVYLQLKWGINEGYVTYLPSYSRFNPPYQGVHLKNSRGLRAMSFYQIPVTDALKKPEIVSGEVTGTYRIRLTFKESGRYILERRSVSGEPAFLAVATIASASTYEDALLPHVSTPVEYRIKRVSENSESEYSNIIRVPDNSTSDSPVIASVTPSVILFNSNEVIVLKGEHFGTTPGKLLVGGKAAEILSWQENEVHFRVPPGTMPGEPRLILGTANELTADSKITIDAVLGESPVIQGTLYPNPIDSDDIFLKIGEKIESITAISDSGKEAAFPFKEAGIGEYRIDTGKSPAGTFILRVKTTSGRQLTFRALKL